MIDPKFLENNLEFVEKKMKERGINIDFSLFRALNARRKQIILEVETLEHERNVGSRRVGELKREGQEKEASLLSQNLKTLSQKIKDLSSKRAEIEEQLRNFLLSIPNIPHESVPVGKGEEDNVEIERRGSPTQLDFEPRDHVEIGRSHDILDLERASKIAGSRFALYKGIGARLERALINFMIDLHVATHGYTEVLPPFVANTKSFIGTGNLPKFEEDLFKLEGTDFYLIPTAEVPVTNIYRDEVLRAEDLPVKFVAYTPCFRKEAGSYGKDVHGIMRQHQFNKVELVKLVHPRSSYDELEKLTKDAAKVLELLELPYRKVVLCTGDLGFSSAKTYDLEVWIPSENRYREISSCSNFEDFQARRANIKYKDSSKSKPSYVHTLNGSGLAVGRTVIAILENFQRKDGTVVIPEVLVPYMGGKREIP